MNASNSIGIVSTNKGGFLVFINESNEKGNTYSKSKASTLLYDVRMKKYAT